VTERNLLAAVADVTVGCPTVIWGYGVGGCLTGLVRAGTVLGRPDLIASVRERVAPSLHRPADPTDHLISVETLQAMRAVDPGLDIQPACERWVSAVLKAARPVPGQPPVHRPDLPPWQSTIWVDCLHTDGPGLTQLGYEADAVRCVEEAAAALQRPDGLFHHGYDVQDQHGNGVAWGRGQAWALLGLLGTLEVVDDSRLRDRLARLMAALASHERNGRWGTIVDNPDAPVENSIAAYLAYAVRRAVACGLVDASYETLAERAYAATLGQLDGGALAVSCATPVGPPASYLGQPTGVFAWGQAPVLFALLDRRQTSASEEEF
jgi:rhamnogalacturonyl hydrolase YesR